MRTFARTAAFALGTFGLVFAGATLDHSAVSVMGSCGPSESCSVGGAPGGTGAVNSDGAAQGGRRTSPNAPGGARTISGNLVSETGRNAGPTGAFTGHYGSPPCTNAC
jgi:hypothetical protein